ncbi:pectate lyase [Echinicola pacifica]|uniref:Pectate lyase n=1 Tax=Echinicola pacifica TaxID=346377 RepID=A0A918UMV3_9BACT|nr:pectate lyase [Echinicola pacifica]GGZ21412.1 pectate lyase [Echinicola pacifica]
MKNTRQANRFPAYLLRILVSCLLVLISIATTSQAQSGKNLSWNEAQRQKGEWFGSAEALRIADNVLLFQNNNGGWNKNIDMAKVLDQADKKKLSADKSKEIGTTIDNGATTSQMNYLAKVYQASKEKKYQQALVKGIDYLLAAQYDNGGWPQYYPLRKGYYTHITYNDNAMIAVMLSLKSIAEGSAPYDFVDQDRRDQASLALQKGLQIIVQTQVEIAGKKTIWCAQHDEQSLAPAKARAYELPSLSSAESVGIVKFLMGLDQPDQQVIEAIESAVAWFGSHAIRGKKVVKIKDESLAKGYDLVIEDDANAGPLWARFYDLKEQEPMFVGRDGIPKKQLSEIEYERRVGYSYIGNYAEKLLEVEYPAWKAKVY